MSILQSQDVLGQPEQLIARVINEGLDKAVLDLAFLLLATRQPVFIHTVIVKDMTT
jgi:hypothetical protein